MLYRHLLRPILFKLSRSDAEIAHLMVHNNGEMLQKHPRLLAAIAWWHRASHNPKPTTVCGIIFPNKVGIAAGFDKDGRIPLLLQAMGFGFITAGSVLPRPQEGNQRPRIFRLPEQGALINRLGFNSSGAHVVKGNLDVLRDRIKIPLGISLGKMKETPLEHAYKDYIEVMQAIWDLADYFEVCISSPNTVGLRQLQSHKYLEEFVGELFLAKQQLVGQSGINKPLWLKIAPDITLDELGDIISACGSANNRKIDALVISNTTTGRPGVDSHPLASETGGLSGKPVFESMLTLLGHARYLDSRMPLIAVGGINTEDRAQLAFDTGANLVQILTGLVYEGPGLVTNIRRLDW